MRKLVVTENITIDGVIDMAAGWFDPLTQDVDQSDIIATTAEHSAAADALLVGRNTFEAFREFWPKQTDDPTGVSDYLNRVNKYVVSRTIGEPGWHNTTVLRGDLVKEVQALKVAPRLRHRRHRQRATRPGTGRHRPGRRVPIIRLPGSRRKRRAVVRVRGSAAATTGDAAVHLRCRAAPL